VPARIDPTSSASSQVKSNSSFAASPASAAVASVPKIASESAGQATGRRSLKPPVRPPSNRMSARAMIPIVRARS
jgi:hypothetical protein